MKRLLYILLLLIVPLWARAQESKEEIACPLYLAADFEIGSGAVIDTYLAPWSYRGWNIGIKVEMLKAMPMSDYSWVWQQRIGLNYGDTHMTISGAGMTIYGGGDYTFALMHRCNTPIKGLQLYYGGLFAVTGEGIYNYHGGNNPVSVKADLSLGATSMAVYNFKWGKLPITARYQLTLPIVGAFVQPEYGESYYEVSLGNHSNFVHCGTWGNRFDIDNLLTIDLRFSNWALRVGYHNSIHTTHQNNIRYQLVQHNFTIGFAGDILSLNLRNDRNNKIVRALYTLP